MRKNSLTFNLSSRLTASGVDVLDPDLAIVAAHE